MVRKPLKTRTFYYTLSINYKSPPFCYTFFKTRYDNFKDNFMNAFFVQFYEE